MEAEIEVHALGFIVELNESQETSTGIERVFEPPGSLNGCETSHWQTGRRNGMGGSNDHVSSATKSRTELRGRAVTIVKLTAADDCLATERAPGRRLVLNVASGPPITSDPDRRAAKDLERLARRVQLASHIGLEVIARLEVARECMPLEIGGLPRGWTGKTMSSIRDDVPAWNRGQVELANTPESRPRLEVDVSGRLPDSCPPDEPHGRIEARID